MLTPVIILNRSPERWSPVPTPDDAKLILPGLALAYAMSSGTVFGGSDGCNKRTWGKRLMLATGAMSRMKL